MSQKNVRRDSHSPIRTFQTATSVLSSLYQHLDHARKEIRLLVIEPGSDQKPIRCNFQAAFLVDETMPAYETISYVWGDATLRATVYVDDYELDVPQSAEIVLKRMRKTDCTRTAWIDAVCINQQDLEDRNYQVQLMCDIYSQASLGLVWLGEDTGCAKEIFDVIRALYDEARRDTDDFESFKAMVWPGWWAVYGAPTLVQFRPEPIARFFDIPWFSRLWVVQEAALTPSSLCHYGFCTIPLLHVLRAAVWLYSKSKSLSAPLAGHRGLARAVHVASYSDPKFETPFRAKNNLLWMLNTLQQYDTSVGKDHVYGLVGMYQRFLPSNTDLPRELIPDYGRSMRDIFCDAARFAMKELKQADVLLYVCHRSSEEVEHSWQPTWVPQWNRKLDLRVDHAPLNSERFEASLQLKFDVGSPTAEDVESLSVNGFAVDQVQEFTEIFTQDTLQVPRLLLMLLQSTEATHGGMSSKAGDLELTLVASLDHQRKSMSRDQSIRGYRALMTHLADRNEIPLFGKPETNISGAYHEALCRWLKNRRVFLTRLGYLGIAPKVIRKGDLVAVIYGCRVPLVLRQHRETSAFTMIGTAYVNGIMSGEAVSMHKERGDSDVQFRIV